MADKRELLPLTEAMQLVWQAGMVKCPDDVLGMKCQDCPYWEFCEKFFETLKTIDKIGITVLNREKTGNYALWYHGEDGWSTCNYMVYCVDDEPYFVDNSCHPHRLDKQEWEDIKKTLKAKSKDWSNVRMPSMGCDGYLDEVTLNFDDFHLQKFYRVKGVYQILETLQIKYGGKRIH